MPCYTESFVNFKIFYFVVFFCVLILCLKLAAVDAIPNGGWVAKKGVRGYVGGWAAKKGDGWLKRGTGG